MLEFASHHSAEDVINGKIEAFTYLASGADSHVYHRKTDENGDLVYKLYYKHLLSLKNIQRYKDLTNHLSGFLDENPFQSDVAFRGELWRTHFAVTPVLDVFSLADSSAVSVSKFVPGPTLFELNLQAQKGGVSRLDTHNENIPVMVPIFPSGEYAVDGDSVISLYKNEFDTYNSGLETAFNRKMNEVLGTDDLRVQPINVKLTVVPNTQTLHFLVTDLEGVLHHTRAVMG